MQNKDDQPPKRPNVFTHIRMAHGIAYPVTIFDSYNGYVLSCRLSTSLEAEFCVETLREAIQKCVFSNVFNTDQGTQFTSQEFLAVLIGNNINISMDGRGRCPDNIFVERLWCNVKYENVCLKGYQTIPEERAGLAEYFDFYRSANNRCSVPDGLKFDKTAPCY